MYTSLRPSFKDIYVCAHILGDNYIPHSNLVISLPGPLAFSCVQTSFAERSSHESSQTVPHWLLTQISSRPSFSSREPLSLTCPVGQVVGEGSGQNTPTSLAWVQLADTSVVLKMHVLLAHVVVREKILPLPARKSPAVDRKAPGGREEVC